MKWSQYNSHSQETLIDESDVSLMMLSRLTIMHIRQQQGAHVAHVRLALPVHQALLVEMAGLVPQEGQETLARQEGMVLFFQDRHRNLLVRSVHLVHPVHQDHLDLKVYQAHKETQALQAMMEFQDYQDHQGLQVRKDRPVFLERKDHQVSQER